MLIAKVRCSQVIGGWEGELLVREKQPDYEERAIEND
jgi:hypothetical protein